MILIIFYKYQKQILLSLFTLVCFTLQARPEWLEKAGAKTFPESKAVFSVNDFGAFKDKFIASTNAIQTAIDSCAANGGGKVTFEPGVYHTGAIFLKSNVNLHIGEGVELKALMGLEYYPEIETRVAGIYMKWPSGIINILDQENVAITGKGTLHAQGKIHWERYWNLRHEYTPKGLRWAADYDCKRVRTIEVSRSTNITIKELTIKQSGFWTVHLLFSKNCTVDGLTILNNIGGLGPSTDGIDIDSSSLIEVMNCDIDAHDDNYCVKAGRDADGLRINIPSEYIYFHDCIARTGGGILVIGSETSGWIRHVYAENMQAIGSNSVLYLKSAKTRGGGIEDIELNNIKAVGTKRFCGVTVNWNPAYSYATLNKQMDSIPDHWNILLQEVPEELGIPQIRDVRINNCSADSITNAAIEIKGTKESVIENFSFNNVKLTAEKTGYIQWGNNISMINVNITSHKGESLQVINSEKIDISGLEINQIKTTILNKSETFQQSK